MKYQQGITSIEFAICGAVLMMVLFACAEISRAAYTAAMLNEGTRRAARLAAVCPVVTDPRQATWATIGAAVNFAGLINFDNSTNVSLNYLDATGASLGATPATSSVYYVRVSITGYAMPLAIPFINGSINFPAYAVTLPAESLGISNAGVSTQCT